MIARAIGLLYLEAGCNIVDIDYVVFDIFHQGTFLNGVIFYHENVKNIRVEECCQIEM